MLKPQTEIQVNINPGGMPAVVKVNQYDTSRDILINLRKGDDACSPNASSYLFEGTKPDGKGFSYTDVITVQSPSSFLISLKEQMTVCAGKVPCQLIFLDAQGLRLASAAFILEVAEAALKDDTDISSSELAPYRDAAQRTLQEVREAGTEIQTLAQQIEERFDVGLEEVAAKVYEMYFEEYGSQEF